MKRFCVQVEFSENAILGSIPRSTTVFGSLCWAIREFESEAKLEKFLGLIEKENALILSDMHPLGWYLIPFNILMPSEQSNDKSHNNKKQTKKWKKAKYCKEDTKIIDQEHIHQWIKEKDVLKTENDFFESKYITRNAIETEKTTPYQIEAYHPKGIFEIIVDSDCFDTDQLKQYFSYFKIVGIGKKTSIGLGVVENITVSEVDFDFEKSAQSRYYGFE